MLIKRFLGEKIRWLIEVAGIKRPFQGSTQSFIRHAGIRVNRIDSMVEPHHKPDFVNRNMRKLLAKTETRCRGGPGWWILGAFHCCYTIIQISAA